MNNMDKIGRNDSCFCGSGNKYKKCFAWRRILPPVQVKDMTATTTQAPWNTSGARLVLRDDIFVLNGSMYPIERETVVDCLAEIRSEIEHEKGEPAIERFITSLLSLITGEFCSGAQTPSWIGWRLNWRDNQPDNRSLPSELSGVGKDSWSAEWCWRRPWWRLDPICRFGKWHVLLQSCDGAKEPDTLKVSCRTLKLADEARSWLEDIAGSVVSFKSGKYWAFIQIKRWKAWKSLPESDVLKNMPRQIMHQYLAKRYETWPEIPCLHWKWIPR